MLIGVCQNRKERITFVKPARDQNHDYVDHQRGHLTTDITSPPGKTFEKNLDESVMVPITQNYMQSTDHLKDCRSSNKLNILENIGLTTVCTRRPRATQAA